MATKEKKSSFFRRIRNYFITGVVVLIPLGITLYLTLFIVSISSKILPKEINPNHYLPYNNMISPSNLDLLYKDVAKYASKPIWLYTSANWYKYISPNFIDNLKRIKNIAGVKYSTSNIVDMQSVQSLADKRFQVISAVVKTLYSCMCLGVKASTTVEAFTFATPIMRNRKKAKHAEVNERTMEKNCFFVF